MAELNVEGTVADAVAVDAASSAASHRGIFITLEGVDGSGKSTQAKTLVCALEAAGYSVLPLREPGGTAISEKIRALLLDPTNAEMADECELMLYEASRAQLVRQVIEPAIAAGQVVLCDRFYDSTHAYQAGGRGLNEPMVRTANELGSCGLVPDLTLVLDIDPESAYARATQGGADRMEAAGLEFQKKVRADYLELATAEPQRVVLVDATGTADEVASKVQATLEESGVLSRVGAGT